MGLLAARYSDRVHYGLWPSDSPEQLRCDGGGEMLPPHRTEMLGSEVSRRRRVVILQLRCSDRTEVMGHVRASRHASVRHHVLIAPSLGLVAQGN